MLFGLVPKLFRIIDILCPAGIAELPRERLKVFPVNEQDAACDVEIVSKHWGIYPVTTDIYGGSTITANPEAGTASLSTNVRLRETGVCKTS